MRLERYDNDGLELFINLETGECFASMSAVARMSKCEVTQIRRLIGDTKTLKTIWVETSNGDKEVKLCNEKQILTCVSKFNPSLLLAFCEAGIRLYLHRQAGFVVDNLQRIG